MPMNAWVALVLAGVFEVAFTSCLKLSENFTKWIFVALFAVAAIGSFSLLASAMKTIPLGTAYAVWTGIGAAGTAVAGMYLFGEPRDALRLFSIALIIAGVAGLRLLARS